MTQDIAHTERVARLIRSLESSAHRFRNADLRGVNHYRTHDQVAYSLIITAAVTGIRAGQYEAALHQVNRLDCDVRLLDHNEPCTLEILRDLCKD